MESEAYLINKTQIKTTTKMEGNSNAWLLQQLQTLESPNKQERQQAETALKNIPDQPALCSTLIEIINSQSADLDGQMRAVIFLKN